MPEQIDDSYFDPSNPSTNVSNEMAAIKKAIHADEGYAWSWWCNLVMSFIDEGGAREIAEGGARRFMQLLFDIDMFKHPLYKRQ